MFQEILDGFKQLSSGVKHTVTKEDLAKGLAMYVHDVHGMLDKDMSKMIWNYSNQDIRLRKHTKEVMDNVIRDLIKLGNSVGWAVLHTKYPFSFSLSADSNLPNLYQVIYSLCEKATYTTLHPIYLSIMTCLTIIKESTPSCTVANRYVWNDNDVSISIDLK